MAAPHLTVRGSHATSRTRAAVILVLALVTACSTTTPGYTGGGNISAGGNISGSSHGSHSGLAMPIGNDDPPGKNVTLAPKVVVVQSDGGKNVVHLDPNGSTIVLAPKSPGLAHLTVGKVLLLTGVGAARVTALSHTADGTAVSLNPIELTDLISDANLDWNHTKIDMSKGVVEAYPDAPEQSGSDVELAPSAYRQVGQPVVVPAALPLTANAEMPRADRLSGQAATGAVGANRAASSRGIPFSTHGFAGELDFEPGSGSLDDLGLKLVLRPLKTFSGNITTSVDISAGDLLGGLKISNGKIEKFDFGLSKLSGNAKISTDLRSLTENASMITPPFLKLKVDFKIPVPIAGIPFDFTAEATIQVRLAFALGGNTLHAEAEVSFDGAPNIHFDGGSMTLSGKPKAKTDTKLKNLQGDAAGPVGIVFTSELPKEGFGLSIFGVGAGVFVSNGVVASFWLAGASSAIPCHETEIADVIAGGIDADFLGKSVTVVRKAFLKKAWDFHSPADARCGKPPDIGGE